MQGHSILVIERITSETGASAGGSWYVSSRTPVAVVFYRDGMKLAFDTDGNPVEPNAISVRNAV